MKKIKTKMPGSSYINSLPVNERLLNKIHYYVFIRHKIISVLTAISIYAVILLLFGESLAISGNYFIIIPVLVASLSFGIHGGIIAGALGLPLNLLFFWIIGHPEFSPESKIIAELSGIIIGSAFGFLSNYFTMLNSEIQHRMEVEKNLLKTLEQKELLFREMQHRAKNNLNIIKSLVQLQKRRSGNLEFNIQSEKLINRIYSISLVHDQLYAKGFSTYLDAGEYLSRLISNMLDGFADSTIEFRQNMKQGPVYLGPDELIPLSLIVNEIVTNSLKYAAPQVSAPVIEFSIYSQDGLCKVLLKDNGPGFNQLGIHQKKLGIKLIHTLTNQLDGTVSINPEQGTSITVSFPYTLKKLENYTYGDGASKDTPSLESE